MDIFRNFLLVFAAIALFVGSFIIFNAFKITVAQRTRQLGLLRAVGASANQVVASVMLEACSSGSWPRSSGSSSASRLAAFLRVGFNAVGARAAVDRPADRRRDRSSSGLVVGMLVTVVAALVPAWKASRVPPVAAMRDDSTSRGPRGCARSPCAVVLAGGGVALVLLGLLASPPAPQRFGLIGLGALLLFVGAAMLTRYVARPAGAGHRRPDGRAEGLAGRLGQENAMRNPSRTAQTAAALTIGVALVTGVTVFAASISETFRGTLDKRATADLVILASNQHPSAPPPRRRCPATRELDRVTAWREGEFKDPRGNTQSLVGGRSPRAERPLRPGGARRHDRRAHAGARHRGTGGLRG